MSTNNTPQREPANRIFAAEFNDAVHEETVDEGERAPRYMLLPTGGLANRIFAVGTLVEVIDDKDNDQYIRGEVIDPTGRFMIDAGQYQQDAINNIRKLDTPSYVAITGKTRVFPGETGNQTKIRVEKITDVPAPIYDTWVHETAEQTRKRIEEFNNGHETAERAEEVYENLDMSIYKEEISEALTEVQEIIKEDQEE